MMATRSYDEICRSTSGEIAHRVKIAQSRLFPPRQLIPRKYIMVIFTAMDHVVPLSQHPDHCGLSGIAVSVYKIDILQIMLDQIVTKLNFYFFSRYLP